EGRAHIDPARRLAKAVLEIHFQRVKPADDAIDRENDAAVIDEHVVDLALAVPGLWNVRHEIADFLRLVRVRHIERPETAAEERAEDDVLALPSALFGQVLPKIVRAVATAAAGESRERRHRAGR